MKMEASSKVKNFLMSLILHRGKFDVMEFNIIRRLIKHTAFQFILILLNLLVFWVIILAGLFGSQVGNKNISIIFVWIVWWFLLIAVLLPIVGRAWCTMCPIPVFGEYIQRRGILVKSDKKAEGWVKKPKRWPQRFNNIWLQNLGFLGMATFSPLLVTRPIITGILLGLLFVIATFMMLIFEKRSFCKYVCPVAGFLGLFSMFSAIELRVKDRILCRNHLDKECINGSDTHYGCPFFVHVPTFERNNYCGLCTECVKACPHDNISLNLRPFAEDIVKKGRRIDEAWKSFIMLTLAGLYMIVLLGPWGWLKDLANIFWVPPYGWGWANFSTFPIHVGIFWFSSLLFTPAIFLGFSAMSRSVARVKGISLKLLFRDLSYELIPLALMAWIAFSIPLLMVNWSYIANVISDPFGLGWNLFGTAELAFNPFYPESIPYLQTLFIIFGLFYAIRSGYKIIGEHYPDRGTAFRAFLPQLLFLMFTSLLFISLFMG